MKRHPVGRIPEEENSYMMNVCIAPSMKWKIFSFQRTKDLVETGVLLIITSLADPGDRPLGGEQHEPVMSPSAFEQFMGLMEKQSFDSDRKEVLDHALLTSWFTTDQCIRLMDFYRFDSEKKQLMKKIYPKIDR